MFHVLVQIVWRRLQSTICVLPGRCFAVADNKNGDPWSYFWRFILECSVWEELGAIPGYSYSTAHKIMAVIWTGRITLYMTKTTCLILRRYVFLLRKNKRALRFEVFIECVSKPGSGNTLLHHNTIYSKLWHQFASCRARPAALVPAYWYVSNVSIIFDVPYLFYIKCHMYLLYFI